MNKKLPFIGICALSTIAIGLSTWALLRSYVNENKDVEYTMYIGTNDKDTYQLEIDIDEARNIIHNTMIEHFSNGFTMYDANGVYKQENSAITVEYTFVCVIENAKESEVYEAADELIDKLDQESILIVANSVEKIEFYKEK